MNNSNNNFKKLYADNYTILKTIGTGSFGEVFMAKHNKTGNLVATKVEKKTEDSRVLYEYKIYKILEKSNGCKTNIPQIYDFIETKDYNMLFMQLLGPSLEDLFNKNGKSFSLPTVFLLANKLLYLLENLHKVGYIHRDIKPNNFLIGTDNFNTEVFITDFGLSKRYIINNKHINFRNGRSLIGTARYASVNMHMGMEPSRRDDLESLGYMLIYFLKGSLPWQGIKKKKKDKQYLEEIGEVKMCTSLDKLCIGMPNCFKEYLKYCKKLGFDEEPDYYYLYSLFEIDRIALKITPKFEWKN